MLTALTWLAELNWEEKMAAAVAANDQATIQQLEKDMDEFLTVDDDDEWEEGYCRTCGVPHVFDGTHYTCPSGHTETGANS